MEIWIIDLTSRVYQFGLNSKVINDNSEVFFDGENFQEISSFIVESFKSSSIIGFHSSGRTDVFVIKNLIGFYLR